MTEAATHDTPAIAGGTPAKQTPFHRGKRYGEEELNELKEALEQGTLFYAHGKKVKQLEEEYAKLIGARFAVSTNSGTTAIHTALTAAGISPGDEVITAPITDMGTLVPILWQGGVPVFADLHPSSYEMLPESVEAAITPKTKAVLAVHLWGNACDLDALKEICARKGVMLVEDCAQAHGCLYDGKSVGTFGEIGCFSLNEFKHISCGDGGLVVTEDEKMATRLRLSTDKCYNRDPNATMRNPVFLANNYRMTELQGAVGVAQTRKMADIVARRQRWCGALQERLQGLPGITLPQVTEKCEPSWWFYMLRVQPEVLGADADKFAEALRAEGLPVSAHYIGRCVYEYPVFTDHSAFDHGTHPYAQYRYGKGLCPNAEAILDTAVMLAINEGYSETDLEETVLAFQKVTTWFAGKQA